MTIHLTQDSLGVLNGQLGLLAEELTGLCDEDASFFNFEVWGADDHIPRVVKICHVLLLALSYLEDQSGVHDAPSTLEDVYQLACPRGLHFPVSAVALDYRLLSFLTTEVQVGFILRKQRRKSQPQDISAINAATVDNKQLAFELKKITNSLSLDTSTAHNIFDILDLIIAKVDAMIHSKELCLSSGQRILEHVTILTSHQRQQLQSIEKSIYQVCL